MSHYLLPLRIPAAPLTPARTAKLDTVPAVRVSVNEQYMMYLMFKPDLPSSSWVPLRHVSWGWSGDATLNLNTGGWSIDNGTACH